MATPYQTQGPRSARRFSSWVRGALWVSALLLGGVGLIVLAYSLIGGVSLIYTLVVVALALLALAYMLAVLLTFERLGGNSRPHDRERRGF